MLLQKTVKGVVSQMEDRGARLGPRHLWGLRLWGLRAETGNGKELETLSNTDTLQLLFQAVESRNQTQLWSTLHPVSQKWSRTASPLSTKHNVASGFTKRWINIVHIPQKEP